MFSLYWEKWKQNSTKRSDDLGTDAHSENIFGPFYVINYLRDKHTFCYILLGSNFLSNGNRKIKPKLGKILFPFLKYN